MGLVSPIEPLQRLFALAMIRVTSPVFPQNVRGLALDMPFGQYEQALIRLTFDKRRHFGNLEERQGTGSLSKGSIGLCPEGETVQGWSLIPLSSKTPSPGHGNPIYHPDRFVTVDLDIGGFTTLHTFDGHLTAFQIVTPCTRSRDALGETIDHDPAAAVGVAQFLYLHLLTVRAIEVSDVHRGTIRFPGVEFLNDLRVLGVWAAEQDINDSRCKRLAGNRFNRLGFSRPPPSHEGQDREYKDEGISSSAHSRDLLSRQPQAEQLQAQIQSRTPLVVFPGWHLGPMAWLKRLPFPASNLLLYVLR